MERTAHRGVLAVVFTVLAVLATTGCSSSEAKDAASESGGDASSADGGSSDDGTSSDIDCAAVRESLTRFTVTPQLLAQLRTSNQWDLVESGSTDLKLDEFQEAIEGVRPLESLPENGADAKDALDTYTEAAQLAAEAQQSPDPVTSEAGVSLAALTEDVQAFLFHQASLAMAMDEANCPTS